MRWWEECYSAEMNPWDAVYEGRDVKGEIHIHRIGRFCPRTVRTASAASGMRNGGLLLNGQSRVETRPLPSRQLLRHGVLSRCREGHLQPPEEQRLEASPGWLSSKWLRQSESPMLWRPLRPSGRCACWLRVQSAKRRRRHLREGPPFASLARVSLRSPEGGKPLPQAAPMIPFARVAPS